MIPKTKLFLVGVALLGVLMMAACGSAATGKIEGGSMSGPLDKTEAGESMYFTMQVKRAGDPVGIDFRGQITAGSASVKLADSQGKVVWSRETGVGSFGFNETLTTLPVGEYHLGLAWKEPVKGQVYLVWKPFAITQPKVGWIAFIPGIGMLLVGLGFLCLCGDPQIRLALHFAGIAGLGRDGCAQICLGHPHQHPGL